MRSFVTILATISLPLYALAAHHGNHVRDHGGVALRARGDLLPKRDFPHERATWYDITAGPVACGGARYGPNDFVIALNHPQFGDTPGSSPYCGKTVSITYNGNTVSAVIVDQCMGCPYGGIDCTEGLFRALAGSLGSGVLDVSWNFGGSSGGGGGGGGGGSAPKEVPTTTSTPEYTPPAPKTTSTPHYDPPSYVPQTTSTPPPPPPPPSSSSSSYSSSTSAYEASSSVSPSTTSMTTSASQSYSLPEALPLASPSSSVASYPSGVADPGGAVEDGQTNAIADIYNCISGLGQIILSS